MALKATGWFKKMQFQNNNYYHIYNRGVDKRDIFIDQKNYIRFLESMRAFNQIDSVGSLYEFKKRSFNQPSSGSESHSMASALVEIHCYCLNKNHYHFLLKQISDNGISKYLHKLGMGYTQYFNAKNQRTGSLFQGRYKAKEIKSDFYLLWLSAYINGNAEIHKIARADQYIWSSYQDYTGKRNGTICNKEEVFKFFEQFGKQQDYAYFVKEVIKESRQRKADIKWSKNKFLLE